MELCQQKLSFIITYMDFSILPMICSSIEGQMLYVLNSMLSAKGRQPHYWQYFDLHIILLMEILYTGWDKTVSLFIIAITLSVADQLSLFLAYICSRNLATAGCLVSPNSSVSVIQYLLQS